MIAEFGPAGESGSGEPISGLPESKSLWLAAKINHDK